MVDLLSLFFQRAGIITSRKLRNFKNFLAETGLVLEDGNAISKSNETMCETIYGYGTRDFKVITIVSFLVINCGLVTNGCGPQTTPEQQLPR